MTRTDHTSMRGVGTLRVAHEAIALAALNRRYTPYGRFRGDGRLRDQLRGACDSVYANIVEGHARRSRRDSLRFVDIAWGSLREYEAHVEVASAAGLLAEG